MDGGLVRSVQKLHQLEEFPKETFNRGKGREMESPERKENKGTRPEIMSEEGIKKEDKGIRQKRQEIRMTRI